MKWIVLIYAFSIFVLCVFAQEDIGHIEEKLRQMAQNGIMTEADAKEKALKIKILQKEQSSFNNQVRGVAATMKNTQVYYFENPEIEVNQD